MTAAKLVQQRSEWTADNKVSSLKFTRTWVRGWLKRNAMRPRRVTAQLKEMPPPAELLKLKKLLTCVDTRGGPS